MLLQITDPPPRSKLYQHIWNPRKYDVGNVLGSSRFLSKVGQKKIYIETKTSSFNIYNEGLENDCVSSTCNSNI